MLCQCGTTMYRSLDGEYHCIKCENKNYSCPVCEDTGYVLQGKRMHACRICGGRDAKAKEAI